MATDDRVDEIADIIAHHVWHTPLDELVDDLQRSSRMAARAVLARLDERRDAGETSDRRKRGGAAD